MALTSCPRARGQRLPTGDLTPGQEDPGAGEGLVVAGPGDDHAAQASNTASPQVGPTPAIDVTNRAPGR